MEQASTERKTQLRHKGRHEELPSGQIVTPCFFNDIWAWSFLHKKEYIQYILLLEQMVQSQCIKLIKYFHPKMRRAFSRSQNCSPGKSEKVRLCFHGALFEYCGKSRRKLVLLPQLNVDRKEDDPTSSVSWKDQANVWHKEGKCLLQHVWFNQCQSIYIFLKLHCKPHAFGNGMTCKLQYCCNPINSDSGAQEVIALHAITDYIRI